MKCLEVYGEKCRKEGRRETLEREEIKKLVIALEDACNYLPDPDYKAILQAFTKLKEELK